MDKFYVFLATGFEDIEALGFIDVCRRASLPLSIISVTGDKVVKSAHNVGIVADELFEDVDFSDASLLYLPGGMPGATNLDNHSGLRGLIMQHYAAGKPLAAICAAPLVYGNLGLLEGLKATCYPGFEEFLTGAAPTGELVVQDGQFFLGKGPAAVLQLSYTIVAHFCGQDVADGICDGMLYPEIFK